MYLTLFLILIVLIVLTTHPDTIFRLFQTEKKEEFKVLGSLASQKKMYYQCLSDCERDDPTKRLSPTKGSMMCQEYCDSTITDIARRGGASYPNDIFVEEAPIKTSMDKAYEKCGSGVKASKCRSDSFTASEIDEKCRQNCAFSTLQPKECMESCTQVLDVNKNLGWNWK